MHTERSDIGNDTTPGNFATARFAGARGSFEPSGSGRGRRASSGVLAGAALLALAQASVAQGSPPRFVVSTTDDVPAGAPFAVDDADLVAVAGNAPVAPFFSPGHWQATAGFAPTDIDGFARIGSAGPGTSGSLAFTLLSNEGGFLDGDVLGFPPSGGIGVLVSEVDLVDALGVPGAAIDVDAIAFDDSGRLLFSLQTDLAATALGDVLDGDILRQETNGSISLVMTEAEVQAHVTAATGLTDAILDVQGVEWSAGDIFVSVQSPSSIDGAVIKVTGTSSVVADEAQMGLGGAEVDALGSMRTGDDIPCFTVAPLQIGQGGPLHFEFYGRPNTILLGLMAGRAGFRDLSRLPGFGGLYLDRRDPWLNLILSTRTASFVYLDAFGRSTVDWVMPAAPVFGPGFAGEDGWSFQVLEVPRFELSAPYRVKRM